MLRPYLMSSLNILASPMLHRNSWTDSEVWRKFRMVRTRRSLYYNLSDTLGNFQFRSLTHIALCCSLLTTVLNIIRIPWILFKSFINFVPKNYNVPNDLFIWLGFFFNIRWCFGIGLKPSIVIEIWKEEEKKSLYNFKNFEIIRGKYVSHSWCTCTNNESWLELWVIINKLREFLTDVDLTPRIY